SSRARPSRRAVGLQNRVTRCESGARVQSFHRAEVEGDEMLVRETSESRCESCLRDHCKGPSSNSRTASWHGADRGARPRGSTTFHRVRVVIAAYSVRSGEEPCNSDVREHYSNKMAPML